MIKLAHPLSAAFLMLCASFSASALAHNPMCECKTIDAAQIECAGGFSDGSGAALPSRNALADFPVLETHQRREDSALPVGFP